MNDHNATISLNITASNPEGLSNALAALAKAFGGYEQLASRVDGLSGNVQPLTGASTLSLDIKREEAAPEPVPAPDPAPAPEPTSAPEPVPAPEPAETIPADSVPTDDIGAMRMHAIEKLTQWFGSNPSQMSALQALQQKYGVKLFKDIPDDKVREFAQDAHLLSTGNPEV